MVIGPLIRPVLAKAARELYRAVNYQDRLINRAWSKARFNRDIRRGVRHGAAGGAILGPLILQDNVVTENGLQTPYQPTTDSQYKTYNRRTRRYNRRSERACYPRDRRLHPYARRY